MELKLSFALFLLISACSALISVDQDATGFRIDLDGVRILDHSNAKPMMSVGSGEFEAIYVQGNYDVNDTITATWGLDNWLIFPDLGGWRIELVSSVDGAKGIRMILTETSPGQAHLDFQYEAFANVDVDRYFLTLPTTSTEKVWGAGEQFTYLDMRGLTYPIWVREQGFGRNQSDLFTELVDLGTQGQGGGDYHTTYWPQPSFLSSKRYYFELRMPTYSELRFAEPNQDVDGHVVYWHRTHRTGLPDCISCDVNFIVKPTLMDVVRYINPGQPPLPEWVYNGAILGVQGGTSEMLGYLQQADDHNASISAMWIQDWSGKITTPFGTRVFWNWKWNETWYPNLDQEIINLKARNVQVLCYITAHLNIDGDVYQSAKDQPIWLLNGTTGQTMTQDFGHFDVATADLTNPDPSCGGCHNPARDWYKNLMKTNILDLGFSGWMADFGEYTPTDAKSRYEAGWWGEDRGEILHQTVSMAWASLNRELLEENGMVGDIMYWMRSGGIQSKEYQVMSWAGDQAVDWTASDGLKSSIVAALSLAVGGMGLSHSDIGGYTTEDLLNCTRSKELLLRWAEYSAFTPVMRSHEGNQPDENWQVYSDDDTWNQFGRLTRMYVDLSPYLREAVDANTLQGKPVMRPLFLDFENDPGSFDEQYEYMYGDDLLVAPVTEPGVTQWSVYLPAGENWIWLWDDAETAMTGPQNIVVPAMQGETPVFYRASSAWRSLFTQINQKYSLSAN